MFSPCPEFQARLIAHAGDASAFETDLAQHVQSCSACADLARRVDREARALRGLARVAAPLELDGLAVAACHGGHRQDRAIGHLRALTRWEAPAELDERLLAAERARESLEAPRVLDRLVDEELRDQPKAITRRFAGRLERLSAPGVLRVRLERSADESSSATRRRLRALVASVLLVALLFTIGGGIYWLERPSYSFEVVHERSLGGLDPLAQSLLGGLTGGLYDPSSTGGMRR